MRKAIFATAALVATMTKGRGRTKPILLSALLLSAVGGAAFAAEPVGSVVSSQGDAALERAGARQTASSGVHVLLDDRATTGDDSRLDLRLGAGTRLRLGANAVLKIDRFIAKVAASTTLDDGAILVDRKSNAEKKFEVKTPYGLLAARGTTFFAGPSKGAFGVFVQKGALDVVTEQGSVRLKAGEGTDFRAPGDSPSPVKKWAAPRIKEALESVR